MYDWKIFPSLVQAMTYVYKQNFTFIDFTCMTKCSKYLSKMYQYKGYVTVYESFNFCIICQFVDLLDILDSCNIIGKNSFCQYFCNIVMKWYLVLPFICLVVILNIFLCIYLPFQFLLLDSSLYLLPIFFCWDCLLEFII